MDGIQQEMEISPEEREQVLSQIETVLAANRTPRRSELTALQAEKRGLLFPLLINLAALLLVASGVLLLVRYFELRKEDITLRRSSYLSAEGTLIQTLKQETETRLQAKEEEIASIQLKLQRVDRERQALQSELESDLESKEEQLRREMEEQLIRERERLAALGTPEAGIIDRLREFQSRQQDSIDREIADFRRQLDAQLQEKERELLDAQRLSEEALARASRERDALLSELRKQESEKSAAEQRLTELTARVQAENLMRDQTAVVFASVGEHLRSQRYAAALQALDGLEDNPVVEPAVLNLLKGLIQTSRRDAVQRQAREEAESAELAAMEAELADKNEEIGELQEQVRAMAERHEADLRNLRAERDALSADLRSARAEQADTLEQGRDDALRDVMTFLRFLSESREDSGDTEQQLLALARRDPLFRAATREIQILIAGGGSAGELASPFLFLGIVSSVTSERAVIEAMVDLEVSPGSVIQIRRIADLEQEVAIAEGIVQQVRGGKITASFKPTASGTQRPAPRDPVYVVSEGD
jgi:hypothetical protein